MTTTKQQLRQLLQEQLITGQTCAKWLPREKSSKTHLARELREFLGMTPKQYRKTVADLSETTEDLMCANAWDSINFNHVPSLAASRYKKAFNRHTTKYAEYVAALTKGVEGVKVNAGAVYPYDVLKGVINTYGVRLGKTELDHVVAQWNALPNYVGDASILPLVDVSGSMTCPAGGRASKSQTTCLEVAVSLGLYLAEKNTGVFKDTFLTFSSTPKLMHLKGNVVEKCAQMNKSDWGMSTDLVKAMDQILTTAVKSSVAQADMPKMLLILSDMQFNQCAQFDDTAMKMVQRKFEAAGYTVPNIVFWNLNAADNVPVKYDQKGAALVSGFSPSVVKAILSADTAQFTPESIMMSAIMVPRYDL